MSRAIGFLFFLLFLAGFALVMIKDMGPAPGVKPATAPQLQQTPQSPQAQRFEITAGDWLDLNSGENGEQPIFIRFHDDNKISGFGGCNSFFGDYAADDNTLELGSLGSTRKACREAVTTTETAFLKAIRSATGYRIQKNELTLIAANGDSVILTLRPTESRDD